MRVYQTITDLVGRTPLLEVTKIEAEEQTGAKIFAKLELFNPAGRKTACVPLAEFSALYSVDTASAILRSVLRGFPSKPKCRRRVSSE